MATCPLSKRAVMDSPPRPMISTAACFQPGVQYQACIPSQEAGLKSDQKVAGHHPLNPHKCYHTSGQALPGRSGLWSAGLTAGSGVWQSAEHQELHSARRKLPPQFPLDFRVLNPVCGVFSDSAWLFSSSKQARTLATACNRVVSMSPCHKLVT